MENPVPYSRVLHKHSLLIMKQGRSGYEPSDTETELHEAPWNEFNKKITELGFDEPRSLNPSRLTRRHSSKFDPEGLPPPRRHNKSPYKTRRGDGSSRSPTPGLLPLPPGRNISPFSKSERRRHVSPFKPARGDDLSDTDEESDASYKPSYARTLSAPRLRSRDKDQQLKNDQGLKRREGRSRTPPSRRSITPRKHKEGNHKSTPSVVEINEMVANARLVKSPVPSAHIFDSTDSLLGGDIFFSRDHAAVSAQKIKNEGLENRLSSDPKLFIEKKPNPLQRYKSNDIPNCNTMVSSSAVSRQSCNVSDVNGKSNGSSSRFTANRRKSQTDTWFSCMGKRSCSTTKKSPERLRAFDEASFIERAFVVENLRQFWADKYQPLSLNEFTCHKQQALQLKQLACQEILPHILLKGPQGSGKKALTMALLCEIFGDSARSETRLTQVAVPVTSSPHHVELNVHLEANARYALMASVKQISSDHAVSRETSTVNLKPDYTVMVLYDVDKADESSQNLIKLIMDCYSDVCKLVLCCQDDVDILESVKTRCHVIKLETPVSQEIMEVLIQISRKENFDLPMKFAAKIANKSKQNLRKATMALEACKSHNYPFVEDQPIAIGWEDVLIDLAAEILADPSHKRLFLTRGKLQKLLVEFVHPKLILLKLIEQFLKGVETNIKRELYYWHGYYDKRLPVGTSALLKLEEFVAKFMSIHRKALHNRQHNAIPLAMRFCLFARKQRHVATLSHGCCYGDLVPRGGLQWQEPLRFSFLTTHGEEGRKEGRKEGVLFETFSTTPWDESSSSSFLVPPCALIRSPISASLKVQLIRSIKCIPTVHVAMPTFTTVALDTLIEPKASKLAAAGKPKPEPKLERWNSGGIPGADRKPNLINTAMTIERKHHWTQISPALYATPEPTPVPDSPLSFPTSPYIVDHKRRGPRLSKTYSQDDAVLHQAVANEPTVKIKKSVEAEDIDSSKVFDMGDAVSGDVKDKHVKFQSNEDIGRAEVVESSQVFGMTDTASGDVGDTHVKFLHKADKHDVLRKSDTLERDGEIDDFFDPHDSMSVISNTAGESSHAVERSLHSNTPFAEFYDAWEELASETGIQHTATDIQGELHELKSGFLIEMEKRKQAETRLNDMRSQWGRIREQLSVVGLSLPADPSMLEDESAIDPGEDLCHQINILRFVSNSVGRGIARAELEVEKEAQLESKNFEINRLLDRLRYYETVNHEMSQRNQENVETMRRLRLRRKRRQRWIWGSLGVAITLGGTALAWSYLPTGKGSSSTDPSGSNPNNLTRQRPHHHFDPLNRFLDAMQSSMEVVSPQFSL
ncbi:hypothetical protein L1987_44418 [Smallanthus sonchifolius]|uniref:Uncharacterized protein n=1 Tax=Smallanthus sonchifolius TaxID=185202 RepID=A0ACB9GPF1_9ASTR|nr:hypothetical protein L1987_44418 [Smallanthus sonchifolius]